MCLFLCHESRYIRRFQNNYRIKYDCVTWLLYPVNDQKKPTTPVSIRILISKYYSNILMLLSLRVVETFSGNETPEGRDKYQGLFFDTVYLSPSDNTVL